MLLAAGLGAMATASADMIDGLKIDRSGAMQFGDVKMTVVFFAKGWKCSRQSTATVRVERAVAKEDLWEQKGKFVPLSGARHFSFEQRMEKIDAQSFRYRAHVANADGIDSETLAFALNVPITKMVGSRLLIDGKELSLTEKPLRAVTFKEVKRFIVFAPVGKLIFEGPLAVMVQDPRYGEGCKSRSNYRFRLMFSPGRGLIKNSSISFIIRVAHYETTPIDMSRQANMQFKDEVADDGKGGWTDQGDNDLRMMKPGRKRYGGVLFNVIDPRRNKGKSCLVFAGPQRDYFLKQATLDVGGPALPRLYLLHAVAWAPAAGTPVGTIHVLYADGSRDQREVVCGREVDNWFVPHDLENGAVAWRGANARSNIGLYLSKFSVQNKAIRALKIAGTGKAVWMVVGVSGGEDVPKFRTSDDCYIVQSSDWRPFEHKVNTEPGSVLDWSFMSDAPAGKYGRVVVRDGRFEFENRPGKRVKFYGTNICNKANYQDKKQCDILVDELDMRGYNSARLHHYDRGVVVKAGPTSTVLDSEQIDKLDYLFHCLKQRGMYITIDLYTVRMVKKGEIPEVDRGVWLNEFKALVPISKAAMDNWKAFSRNLLTHKNPYTGLAWKDDPALYSICLLNEDNTFVHWNVAPDIRALYEKQFDYWLKGKAASGHAASERAVCWAKFLFETQVKMYDECAGFLRSLGVKALLTDANYRKDIPLSLFRDRLDYVDNHTYWDMKKFLAGRWKLPYGHRQRMAVGDLAAVPRNLMPTRLFGKPFTVTEYNYCYPNHYRGEGGALMGAYAALQDWDAVYRYCYAHEVKRSHNPTPAFYLDYITDPINLLAERIVGLLFFRGDVKPANTAIPFVLDESALATPDALDRRKASVPQTASLLGLYGKIGSVALTRGRRLGNEFPCAVGTTAPGAKALSGKEYYSVDANLIETLSNAGIVKRSCLDAESKRFASETGQIHLDGKSNHFRVVTERSECFVVPDRATVGGDSVSVTNEGGFAVVFVSAVDGRPIPRSKRLLVLHLTDVQNSLVHFGNRQHTVLHHWGKLPHLIRRGSAQIQITLAHASSVRCWAVDMSGARRMSVALQRNGRTVSFTANTVHEGGNFMAYEITAKQR